MNNTFVLTLSQVVVMLFFVLFGILLRKKNIVSETAGTVVARIETYVFAPCSLLYSFLNHCTVENFARHSSLVLYGAITVAASVAVAYPLSKLFVKNYKENPSLSYKRDLYKYALAFGNYGYFGRFLVQSIWGDLAHFYFLMFLLVIEIVCGCWGLYVLVPKNENESRFRNFLRGFTTLPILSLFLGIILGLTNAKPYIPQVIMTVLQNGSNCYGPVAMLLGGIVIGGYRIRELFAIKKTYIVSFLRLIVIPAIMLTVYKLFGLDKIGFGPEANNVTLMIFVLSTFAAPLGLGTIIFPAAYGGDPQSGASMVLISTLLATITLPLMYLIFV